MRRFKEKEKVRQMKEAYQQELMRRLKEKEEIRHMKGAIQRELMMYHRKKQEDRECFVPRKLFLFNIDTFSCPPMPNSVQQNENKEGASKSEEERSAFPPTKFLAQSVQKKPKQSLKRRLKKLFGGK
nr:uncharacterized protein LOC109620050 [Crassostrea gigas]